MKNTIKILGIISVVMLILCSNINAVNVVKNSDFEVNNENWDFVSGVSIDIQSDNVYAGVYSANFTSGEYKNFWFVADETSGINCSYTLNQTFCDLNDKILYNYSMYLMGYSTLSDIRCHVYLYNISGQEISSTTFTILGNIGYGHFNNTVNNVNVTSFSFFCYLFSNVNNHGYLDNVEFNVIEGEGSCGINEYWNGSACVACVATKTVFDDNFKSVTGKKSDGSIVHIQKIDKDYTSNYILSDKDSSLNLSVQGYEHLPTPVTYNYADWVYTFGGDYFFINWRDKQIITPLSYYRYTLQTTQISDSYWTKTTKIIDLNTACVYYNVVEIYNFSQCLGGWCFYYLDEFFDTNLVNQTDNTITKTGNETYNVTDKITNPSPYTAGANGSCDIYDGDGNKVAGNDFTGHKDVNGDYVFNNTPLNFTGLNKSQNYTFVNTLNGYNINGNISEQYSYSATLYYNNTASEWFLFNTYDNSTVNMNGGNFTKQGFQVKSYTKAGAKDDGFDLGSLIHPEAAALYLFLWIGLIIIGFYVLINIYGGGKGGGKSSGRRRKR